MKAGDRVTLLWDNAFPNLPVGTAYILSDHGITRDKFIEDGLGTDEDWDEWGADTPFMRVAGKDSCGDVRAYWVPDIVLSLTEKDGGK